MDFFQLLIIALGSLIGLSVLIIFLTSFILKRRGKNDYTRKSYSHDNYVPKKRSSSKPSKYGADIDEAMKREVKTKSNYVQKGNSLIEDIMGQPDDTGHNHIASSATYQRENNSSGPTGAVATSRNNNVSYNSLDLHISKEIDREFQKEFGIPYDEDHYRILESEIDSRRIHESSTLGEAEEIFDFEIPEPVPRVERRIVQESYPAQRNQLEDLIAGYDEEDHEDIFAPSKEIGQSKEQEVDKDKFLAEKVDEYEKKVDKEYPECFGTSEKYSYCNKDCGFSSSCKKVIEVINKI